MSCFFALFPNRIIRFLRHFYLEMLSLGEQPFQVASETERSDHHPNEPIIFPVHLIRNLVFRFLRRPLNPLIFLAFSAFLPSVALRFLRVFYGPDVRVFHEFIQVVFVTGVTHSFSTVFGGFSLQMTRNRVVGDEPARGFESHTLRHEKSTRKRAFFNEIRSAVIDKSASLAYAVL